MEVGKAGHLPQRLIYACSQNGVNAGLKTAGEGRAEHAGDGDVWEGFSARPSHAPANASG